MGYYQAGFEVVGVDITPQPHYPFPFIQADALTFPLDGFDVIHASPPCQAYSAATGNKHRGKHPNLLPVIRERLLESGKPWIIENVIGAPIHHGIMLCGSMFGLPIQRHRWFETSHLLFAPCHCQRRGLIYSIHGHNVWLRDIKGKHGSLASFGEGLQAMEIDWMKTQKELTQAIPPAYTRYIGERYMEIFLQASA